MVPFQLPSSFKHQASRPWFAAWCTAPERLFDQTPPVIVTLALYFTVLEGRRGHPMLADPVLGKKIIDDLIKFSAPYGTKITFQDGVGIVEIPQ